METIKEEVEELFKDTIEFERNSWKPKFEPTLDYYDNRLDEEYPYEGRFGIHDESSEDEKVSRYSDPNS